MKHTINVQRPDGSNMKSFPSGHTATVFTGSHILFMNIKIVVLGSESEHTGSLQLQGFYA